MKVFIKYQFHDKDLKPFFVDFFDKNENGEEVKKQKAVILKDILSDLAFMITKSSDANPKLAYSIGFKIESCQEDWLELEREEINYLADLIQQKINVNTQQGQFSVDREPLIIAQTLLVLDGKNPWDAINPKPKTEAA